MPNRHERGRMRRRAATGEFIQDQLKLTDDINREDPENVIYGAPATLGDILASAEEEDLKVETISNLLSSGHIVDPIAHIYDFEIAPVMQNNASETTEELDDGYETAHCNDVDRESRYPESREVYLGVLGLLKRPGPAVEVPMSGETGEHDIAEWYFKRHKAFRPEWGQLGAR